MSSWSDALRDEVRRSVAEHEPIDDVEGDMIADFLTQFDALPNPFDEAAGPTHVTGSAIVTGRRGVVLVKHKRFRIWLQPGGHIDPGESPADAALREAEEETGLEVRFAGGRPRLVHVDVHPGPRGHTHLDLRFLVEAGDAEPAPGPDESQDVAWFDWDAAIEIAGDDRLRSLLKVLRAG
jgi:8-oxo-dGTP pyrophosphatase MutT (NUDIX family)